jgi:hypothetical protein
MNNETENAKRSPPCEDCRIPTILRASIFDARKGGYIRIFDCPSCKRLYWKE